jgi:hypothetical protein
MAGCAGTGPAALCDHASNAIIHRNFHKAMAVRSVYFDGGAVTAYKCDFGHTLLNCKLFEYYE